MPAREKYTLDEIKNAEEKIMQANQYAASNLSNKTQECITILQEAIDLGNKFHLFKLVAQSNIWLSNIFYNLRDLDAAFEKTNIALKIYENEHDEAGIAKCYNAIAALSGELERYEIGVGYLKKALDLNIKNQVWVGCVLNCMNIGFQENKLGHAESCLIFFEKAEEYVELIENQEEKTRYKLLIYQKLMDLYNSLNKFDLVQYQVERTLSLIGDDEKYNEYKAIGKLYEGNFLSQEGKYEASIQAYEEGYALSNKAHYLKLTVFENLADLYQKTGNFEQASKYYELLYKESKERFAVEKENAFQELITKFDVQNKEKEAEIHRLKYVEISEKNKIIEQERKKSEDLLLNILPAEIVSELKTKDHIEARSYDSATIMFADMKNFTVLSENLEANSLLEILQYYFKAFDQIMEAYNIEKIKTIGDCYMCCSGIPTSNEFHAQNMINAAIKMNEFVEMSKGKYGIHFRFGIHSGPIVAGIVGLRKYSYDIWGDSVNIAARMEQAGEIGKINVSASTYELAKDFFNFEHRGKIPAKHKGEIDMYFVSE